MKYSRTLFALSMLSDFLSNYQSNEINLPREKKIFLLLIEVLVCSESWPKSIYL